MVAKNPGSCLNSWVAVGLAKKSIPTILHVFVVI